MQLYVEGEGYGAPASCDSNASRWFLGIMDYIRKVVDVVKWSTRHRVGLSVDSLNGAILLCLELFHLLTASAFLRFGERRFVGVKGCDETQLEHLQRFHDV